MFPLKLIGNCRHPCLPQNYQDVLCFCMRPHLLFSSVCGLCFRSVVTIRCMSNSIVLWTSRSFSSDISFSLILCLPKIFMVFTGIIYTTILRHSFISTVSSDILLNSLEFHALLSFHSFPRMLTSTSSDNTFLFCFRRMPLWCNPVLVTVNHNGLKTPWEFVHLFKYFCHIWPCILDKS